MNRLEHDILIGANYPDLIVCEDGSYFIDKDITCFGDLEIALDRPLTIGGCVTVYGTMGGKCDIVICNEDEEDYESVIGLLNIGGSVMVTGCLTVHGDAYVGRDFDVSRTCKISGDLKVCGDLYGGDYLLTGYADIMGNVSGVAWLKADSVTCKGSVEASAVSGDCGIYVDGDLATEDSIESGGRIICKGDLSTAYGNVNAGFEIDVRGAITINHMRRIMAGLSVNYWGQHPEATPDFIKCTALNGGTVAFGRLIIR